MNVEAVKLLNELADIYGIIGEPYREKAFRAAAHSLGELDWSICDDPERLKAEKIHGVGKGILDRLLEYCRTGRIKELSRLKKDRRVKAHETFSKIIGVGPATVAEWLDKGVYNLRDLRAAIKDGKITLTKAQQYGLKYYSDLNKRIPRAEVAEIGRRMKRLLKKIIVDDFQFIIAGSYRRGAADSGDVDILVSTLIYDENFLARVGTALREDSAFIDFVGVGRERLTFLYNPHEVVRQVDVLYLPADEYWPGVLYFTGSWDFNETMRSRAKRMGYRLNQRGLFKIEGRELKKIPVSSEHEIFDLLQMKYVAPPNRHL